MLLTFEDLLGEGFWFRFARFYELAQKDKKLPGLYQKGWELSVHPKYPAFRLPLEVVAHTRACISQWKCFQDQ